MRNFKIFVEDFKAFENLQSYLFNQDCFWVYSGKSFIPEKDFYYYEYFWIKVFANKIERMTRDGFKDSVLPEFELRQTISYDLKEIPKNDKKVVKVGNLSYYEDELAEALKNIKPL